MQIQHNVGNEAEMIALGQDCAEHSDLITSLYLVGELGAGKTTFARGLLRGLGHDGPVKSPTYTLVESYPLQMRTVYHFDLYRLSEAEELEAIGVRDYFTASDLCLIEWPERGSGFLPDADVILTIEYAKTARNTRFEAHSEAGIQFLKSLNLSR